MNESISNLWSIPLFIIIPILAAILLNVLYSRKRAISVTAVVSSLALIVVSVLSPFGFHWFTGHPSVLPTGGYTYRADLLGWNLALEYYYGPLQQIAIFLAAVLLLFVVLIAINSLKKNIGTYISLLFLTFMSAAIVIMVNDFYHLWIGVEIGSLIVAGVVLATGEAVSQKAALKYTFFSALSGAGLAIALALILGVTGYANISDAIIAMPLNNASLASILYVAFGFTILSWIYAGGLAPIHPLKADVYGSAFPHATILLQTQSKLMLVAIGLVILRLFGTLPFAKEVMLSVSVLTMMIGVVMAMLQTDFRWTLAYLIVSHSGLVTLGISLGTVQGIIGGLFQAVNDVVYMSVLLLACEGIYYFGRGTSIKTVSGIARRAPWLAVAAIIGAFAASGVPPFNGFQSEIILIQASLNYGIPELAIVVLLVSVTTFIALFKGIYNIFLRPDDALQAGEKQGMPIPRMLYVCLAALIFVMILFGVYPQLAINFLNEAALKVVYIPWVP